MEDLKRNVDKTCYKLKRNDILVGGFKHGFYFPFHIWDVIIPIDDFIIFQDG